MPEYVHQGRQSPEILNDNAAWREETVQGFKAKVNIDTGLQRNRHFTAQDT